MPRIYYYIVSLYWCSFLLLGFTFSILSVSINFTFMFTISLDMFLWCLMKNCSKTNIFECFVIRERHKLKKIRNVTLKEGWPFEGIISPMMWSEVSVAKTRPSGSIFLLFVDPNVELLAVSPAPCLAVCHHAPCDDDNSFSMMIID